MTWKPLWEANADRGDCLRRVIMAGYRRDGTPHVGEAFYGSPSGERQSWHWSDGGEVRNPLGFQDLPDFPVPERNDKFVCGGPVRMVASDD